jgi:hypothetical protein
LVLVRLGITGENKPAAIGSGQMDIHHLQGGEFFQDGAGGLRALINSEVKIMALARGQNLKNRVGGWEILPIAG